MPEHTGGDACAHAPEDERPAAPEVEKNGGRQLLQHPGFFQPPQDAVVRDEWLDLQMRRPVQVQFAMQLPPRIGPETAPVAQVVVAHGQTLRVVAQLMLAKNAQWSGQADLHAAIDECKAQPPGALEAVVNQLAMAAQRVAEEQHEAGADNEQRHRIPAKEQAAADQGGHCHA
ncbi:hypothetical protein D3C85_1268610 [compost metagenome]